MGKIARDSTMQEISATLKEMRNVMMVTRPGTIYAFHIDGSEGAPEAKITYLEDAVGKVPARMDYTAGKFLYGGWGDAFFMPKPCMVKYDGTVDYYLDVNDYSKKEDGTASDVSNTAYEGNAMMEWGQNGKKIWYKIVPDVGDNTSATIYVADYQADDNYHAYSFINNDGDLVDHFYTPCYFGSIIDGKLRSLSGVSGADRCKSKTAAQERELAKANNTALNIWDLECYADVVLINILLMLIGKTTQTQTVFGQGLHTSGSDAVNDAFVSGQHDTKGLFYGTNSGAAATYTNAVKVFGMENYWGFMWRRINGLVALERVIRYKMTHTTADGSAATDYIVSTSSGDYGGYLTGATMPTASGTYIQTMEFDENQFGPTAAAGSASTDYCDGLWTNSGCRFAYRGGSSSLGAHVGAFCLVLNGAASLAYWGIGAAPSLKPRKG